MDLFGPCQLILSQTVPTRRSEVRMDQGPFLRGGLDAAVHFCGVEVFSHGNMNHTVPVVLRAREQFDSLLDLWVSMQLV